MNFLFLSLICFSLSFQLPPRTDPTDEQSRTSQQSDLPFRLASNYLIQVNGRIGTQSNLKFILDTGATISIVDRKIADRLKLDSRPGVSFNFDRKLDWESVTIPEIQFGPIRATQVDMFTGHLSSYSEFAKSADAIIGVDLLKMTNFNIEFETKKIAFYPTDQKPSVSSNDPISNCFTLQVQIQGQPLRLLVDTGFPGILLYEGQVRKRIPSLRVSGNVTNMVIGEHLKAKQVVVPGIALGKTMRDLTVLFVASPSTEMLRGIDGIVGITPLKARSVHFDSVEKTVSWE